MKSNKSRLRYYCSTEEGLAGSTEPGASPLSEHHGGQGPKGKRWSRMRRWPRTTPQGRLLYGRQMNRPGTAARCWVSIISQYIYPLSLGTWGRWRPGAAEEGMFPEGGEARWGLFTVKHYRCDGRGDPRKGRFNDWVSLCCYCRKLLCLATVHQLSVTSLMARSTLPRALKTICNDGFICTIVCVVFISTKAVTGQGKEFCFVLYYRPSAWPYSRHS